MSLSGNLVQNDLTKVAAETVVQELDDGVKILDAPVVDEAEETQQMGDIN